MQQSTTLIEKHLVSLIKPGSFEAEQYRTLRYIVEQRHKNNGLQVVAVSSPAAGDGKTTTALNLAGALAQGPEARVLLLEMDLRLPAIGGLLGMEASEGPGLADVIRGTALDDVIWHFPPYNLSILPAGPSHSAPYELLKSPGLDESLGEMRRRYEYIVVDTPPILPFPDCRIMGRWADGFLIVVAAHKTPRKLVAEALDIMQPNKVIGLVFNGDDRPRSRYYGYYGYYNHGRGSSRGARGGFWRRLGMRTDGSRPRGSAQAT